MEEIIDKLNKLRVKKMFYNGNHAKSVALLEGDIIRKEYIPSKEHELAFDKEIEFLTYLKNYKYVAKLIAYDRPSLTFWVTYCGPTPPRTPKNLKMIRDRAIDIHHKTGAVRHYEDGKIQYNVYVPNTGMINGKIYFFDFGGLRWKIDQKFSRKYKSSYAYKNPMSNSRDINSKKVSIKDFIPTRAIPSDKAMALKINKLNKKYKKEKEINKKNKGKKGGKGKKSDKGKKENKKKADDKKVDIEVPIEQKTENNEDLPEEHTQNEPDKITVLKKKHTGLRKK